MLVSARVKLHFSSDTGSTAHQLYRWHVAPGAFTRLSPAWESVALEGPDGPIQEGTVRVLRVGPLRQRWVAVHDQFEMDAHFRDYQRKGPFRSWRHNHRFLAGGRLSDEIECTLPFHALTALPARELFLKPTFKRMFCFRHLRTAFDLGRQFEGQAWARKVIAVTGSSGLIGHQLCAFLSAAGHRVIRLVRRSAQGPDERSWDPTGSSLPHDLLEGVDAVVHLAGANVAGGLWTRARRKLIRDSRVEPTRLLARAIRAMDNPPEVLLVSSGINYYGQGGLDQPFTETSGSGSGFLAGVCREWERAAFEAASGKTRVVVARTGMVLARSGGALPKLLWPNWLGLGSIIGSGRQGVSWIGLEDMVGVLYRCLYSGDLEGPVNAVSPGAVSASQFAEMLARVTRRPLLLRVPAPLLRLSLGEFATVVTEGNYVRPQALHRNGFRFVYPELEGALRHELGLYTPEMLPRGFKAEVH